MTVYRILHIVLMDWGSGHLTIIVGTGTGHLPTKIFPQGRAFDQYFQMPGVCPGGMLAVGIDLHIIHTFNYHQKIGERSKSRYSKLSSPVLS